MKDFFQHIKEASRVSFGITLILVAVIIVAGFFYNKNIHLNERLQAAVSMIKYFVPTTTPPEKVIAPVVTPPACDEKIILKKAKECTYLVGNANQHGSSFLIDVQGWLVTNYHVIEYSEDGYVEVFYEGNFHKSRIAGFSEENDIAVIKIEPQTTACSWASNTDTELAEPVYAVGWPNSPYGESTITKGIISRMTVLNENTTAIQTDTPINPGNSGGPLVDKCGVVGINTSKVAWIDKDAPSEGIGYAITADYARVIVDKIVAEDDGAAKIPTRKEPVEVVIVQDVTREPIEYDYQQVIFWEQRKIQDKEVFEDWRKVKKVDLVDQDKLNSLLDMLEKNITLAEGLWDGYTNSKITQLEVYALKQEYLRNSNQIAILTKDLNIEGSINAYKSCLSAWEELEKEYDDDFSEQKEECTKFINVN